MNLIQGEIADKHIIFGYEVSTPNLVESENDCYQIDFQHIET